MIAGTNGKGGTFVASDAGISVTFRIQAVLPEEIFGSKRCGLPQKSGRKIFAIAGPGDVVGQVGPGDFCQSR